MSYIDNIFKFVYRYWKNYKLKKGIPVEEIE